MSEAPERIWAWAGSYPAFDSGDWCNGTATDDASRGGVEYVRADRVEELVATCEELQARVAELEAVIDSSEHDGHMWRFWSDKARELATKNAAAEALLSEAVKAGMLEGAVVATQYHDEVKPWVQKVKALPSMADKSDALQIAEILGDLANHSQTIARIVAQVKEGRG